MQSCWTIIVCVSTIVALFEVASLEAASGTGVDLNFGYVYQKAKDKPAEGSIQVQNERINLNQLQWHGDEDKDAAQMAKYVDQTSPFKENRWKKIVAQQLNNEDWESLKKNKST